MSYAVRIILFSAVCAAGVASLLASSMPPVFLSVSTLNNLGYASSYLTYVCQGESITFSWDEYYAGTLLLSADPAESFAPPLSKRQVDASGTLEVTAQGDAEVRLSSQEVPDGEMRVELLSETLCERFGFPLIGWYKGSLEQTSPTPLTLTRQLALYAEPYTDVVGEEEKPRLYVRLGETLDAYPPTLAPCTLDAAAAQLDCRSEEAYSYTDSTFKLTAQITEGGLRGSYSGAGHEREFNRPFFGHLQLR